MAGRKGEKWWSDAIKLAITETLEGDACGRTKLRAAADALVAKALDGDVTALKEIGDRLDGKAQQAIVGGDEDSPPIRFARVERVIVDAKD